VAVRQRTPSSLHDRLESLLTARADAEAEAARLHREAEYLAGQVRQAQEQVRHYEGLLAELRRDWGGAPRLTEIVRRLG
jgi:predicted  nucleic acid-binding Zn-ribbon protein